MTLEDYYLPGPPYGPGKKPIVGFNRIALAVLLRGSAFLVSTFRRGSERGREKVGKEDVEREREVVREVERLSTNRKPVTVCLTRLLYNGREVKMVYNFININTH